MKALNWIIALLGLWEFGDIAAPFVPGFGQVPAFLWNHILVGLVLMVCGVWAARTASPRTARTLDGIAALAGAWLVLASFLLGNPAAHLGLWNDIAVGAIVVILATWSAIASSRTAGSR